MAITTTPLQAAKMNNGDPLIWLTRTIERIANGWPSSKIGAPGERPRRDGDFCINRAFALYQLRISMTLATIAVP